ncbi:MAG: hypothetical protein AAB225_25225 [Acidobacteriota bacterium]
MTFGRPVQFLESKTLADLAAIAAGDSLYLVSVENTFEMVPSPIDAPAQRTNWRLWKPNNDGSSFQSVSQSGVVIPTAKAVAVAVHGNLMAALLQVNEPQPAYLMTWELAAVTPPEIPAAAFSVAPVRLDEPEAAQVHINIAHDWSTRRLPSSRWLFSSNLSSFPRGDNFGIAMNTADAHAIAWLTDGKSSPARPRFFIPDALDPVFKRAEGKDFLFYRKTPADWPVFFHDIRYSRQYGPVLLPLMVAELNSEGKITSRDLSKDHEVGGVFAFEVASDGSKRLALSVVGGTKEQPLLRVYVSHDLGRAFRVRQTTRLRKVPYRIATAMAGADVLIGLAYLSEGAREAEGLLVSLE